MEIHKLTTSGPAAAALLQEGAVAQGAFDGLLIGKLPKPKLNLGVTHLGRRKRALALAYAAPLACAGSTLVRTESVLHDTRDETKQELLEVHISAFCCCSGLGSFYNAAGDVEGNLAFACLLEAVASRVGHRMASKGNSAAAEEVSSIAQAFEGSFLGWFVYHDGPHRAPTIRERAVTAALAQLVPPDVPVLFALMSSTLDSDRATAGFEQQFLEQVCLLPFTTITEFLGSLQRYGCLFAVLLSARTLFTFPKQITYCYPYI